MRAGIGHPHFQVPCIIETGDCGIGFSLKVAVLGRSKSIFPDQIRVPKALLDVSHVNVHMDIDVVGIAFVDEGTLRRHGLKRIIDGWKFFEVKGYQVEGLYGGVFIHGRHGSNLLPEISNLVPGEELHVLGIAKHSPLHSRRVFPGNDCLYAFELFGFCGVHMKDAGVGQRASFDHAHQHPWK